MEVYFIIAAILVFVFVLIFLGGGTKVDKQEVEKGMYDAEKLMISDDPSKVKDGLIKFDNLLNKALQMKGFRGDSLGERLKASQKYFQWSDYSGLWEAHKIRNKVVHEDFTPGSSEIKKSVKYFKTGIKKLIK